MTDSSEAIEIKEDSTVNVETTVTSPDPSRRRIGAIIGISTFVGIIVIVIIVTVLTISSPEKDSEALPIKSSLRLDCLPKRRIQPSDNDKKLCEARNCIYDSSEPDGSPACYFNINNYKYKLLNKEPTNLGEKYTIENSKGGYNVSVEFEFLKNNVFRFKLSKVLLSGKNYEVPIKVRTVENKAENTNYEVVVSSDKNDFYFKIIRKSTRQVLWDTSIGGLIFDKNFIQIATYLPSQYIYGFGENNHETFKHNTSYKSWPLFSRDQPPGWQKEANLYGVQPFYTCMEKEGTSHGVLLVNSNAMDYEFLPEPALVYRTTGGVLDFYAFFGPEPENVIQQYTHFVGRPFMPPYWALGFQVSRYGYLNLDDMKDVLKRMKNYNIPIDTQVADIDHMDERKMFTIDEENWKGIDVYFKELESQGMKTIILFDPFIIVNVTNYKPFENGKSKGVFITWPNGVQNPDYDATNSSIMVGYCWPKGKVAYPDFFKKVTQEWWIDEILKHRREKLIFHGLWIDMNEPAVFGTNEERPFNWPESAKPYWSLKCPDDDYENVEIKASFLHTNKDKKMNKLSDKTLCMTAVQGEKNEYKHFDVHSLYGYSQQIPTFEAAQKLDNARGLVITRSNYIGTGQYAGHWTGDNDSKWSDLYYSIIGMLEFNLFGIPYVGADICGFWYDATEELCHRWSLLGAFYPFSRNHNGEKNINQDPAAFSPAMARSVKKVLDIRYEILPFYYTLFFKAHSKGNTVIRPLFHEFPSDVNTYSIDRQFLIGPAILISPVLEAGVNEVNAYFAKDYWYSYYDGEIVRNASGSLISGGWKKLNAPIDFIPIHIRGGHIIPTQEPANNTHFSRKNPFGLIVAMDWDGEAKGDLFFDDGESKKFEEEDEYYHAIFIVKSNKLQMNIAHDNYKGMSELSLDTIRIFVENNAKITFKLNGIYLDEKNIERKPFELRLKNLNLPMNKEFELSWYTYQVNLYDETRIDCSVEEQSITKAACESKKCVFDSEATGRVPKCYIPKNVGGYVIKNINNNTRYELGRSDSFSLYGNEIENLVIEASYGSIDGIYNVARVKIFDGSNTRYEVPVELNMKQISGDNSRFKITVQGNNKQSYFEVRADSKPLIDNKNLEHGFVFSDQFIQLAINLGYKNVYGFGENSHFSFKHEFEYSNFWGIFGRDQPPGGKGINLYGTQPFLMAVNENGRALGILILNSNAMEYGFLPPQVFSYRTLGGILDIYVLEEESPEKLIQAYTSLIGKPYMPPYWSLGFQLCRYGYNSLKALQAAVDRTRKAGIPLDVQYADIDHFEKQLDFTYDQVNFKGLPEYIRELNSSGIRFIIILDPAINSELKNYGPYDRGTQDDIWIKWPSLNNPQKDEMKGNNIYMIGYVWPEGKAVFPDFFLDKTKKWWKNEIVNHFKTISFDGLWIDMNEPANFDTNKEKPFNYPSNLPPWNLKCPTDNKLDNPPYLPLIAKIYGKDTLISDKTICMIGKQNGTQYDHYDVHNLYGWSQSEPTLDALRASTNQRGIVISRSTYVSSGKYAGHWLGDNTSKWKDLKFNIIGLLEFNLFGIPYIGADICGFFDNTTPELCQRWMQIGAFNTFYRNHNGYATIDQDPAALGENVAYSSKIVTEIRYTLLPYLYTLFYEAHKNGGTVIRSLMHEFSKEKHTEDIDQQFMWGSALLISPVVNPNTRVVFAYFPKARWFDYYDGKEIKETGRIHELDAPSDFLPLHIKGGSLLVTQESANNTRFSRMNSFGLIIAPDSTNSAMGSLYWDGGEEINPDASSSWIKFDFKKNGAIYEIKNEVLKNNYKFLDSNILNTVRIFGQMKPSKVLVDNQNKEWKYDSETKEIKLLNLRLKINEQFTIYLYF